MVVRLHYFKRFWKLALEKPCFNHNSLISVLWTFSAVFLCCCSHCVLRGEMPPHLLHPPLLFSLLKTQTECETFPDLQFPSKKELNISLFYVSIATYKCRCFTYSGGFPYCKLDIIKYIGTWIAVARLVTDSITQLWFGAATAFCSRTIRLNEWLAAP